MVSPLFFYQLVLVALVWLCVMLQWAWPSAPATAGPTTLEPTPPRPKRRREPKPFTGLTTKPHCDACEQDCVPRLPPRMVKIFELAFLLEVTLPTIAALHLVFRPPVTDTHRQ